MEQEYKVKLEVFEGPLDLLLYLIKKDEIDIYDIPVERITAQYLEYLDLFKTLDIELAGEFVVMAATLMYIKSRCLLPVEQRPPDEQAEEDDPRWELVRQLIEYKKFKDAAAQLQERELYQADLFGRASSKPEIVEARPIAEVSILDLITAFNNVIKRLAKPEDLREIFEENFTVSDKIDLILKMTESGVPIQFEEMFAGVATRTEVVVTFLALLELIRMKHLRAIQEESFGPIILSRVTGETLFSRAAAADPPEEEPAPAPIPQGS
jgi:segregation and condensation protein A